MLNFTKTYGMIHKSKPEYFTSTHYRQFVPLIKFIFRRLSGPKIGIDTVIDQFTGMKRTPTVKK